MKTNTTDTRICNNHVITTEEGTKIGIFFRSPIQKIIFDAYTCSGDSATSAWMYKDKLKNPIRRLYEILIGNGEIVRSIDEWSKSCDWAGFKANKLMSPIYFVREFRRLLSVSSSADDIIQKVSSYGYEGPYNICSGACHIEKTCITLKNGKKIRIKKKGYYQYTFAHVVEDVITSGTISRD